MPDRTQLLAAIRTDHPEFSKVSDNALFAAFAQDHPDIAIAAAKSQEKPFTPSGPVSQFFDYLGVQKNDPATSTASGFNDPTKPSVASEGAARVLQGAGQAVAAAPQTVTGIAQFLSHPMSSSGALAQSLMDKIKGAAHPDLGNPESPAWASAQQGAGNLLASAEMPNVASKAGEMADALMSKIPSKAAAGAKFQTVMDAAKNVPIDTTEAGNAALRAEQLSKTGSTMPKVLNDFMKYPGDRPLNYEIGRDFASNAGALSASEKLASNPQMLRQVGAFADAMKTANRAAAESVGMGSLYDDAMSEYAKAASMADKAAIVKKWAGRAGAVAALGAAGRAGYDLYEKLK